MLSRVRVCDPPGLPLARVRLGIPAIQDILTLQAVLIILTVLTVLTVYNVEDGLSI